MLSLCMATSMVLSEFRKQCIIITTFISWPVNHFHECPIVRANLQQIIMGSRIEIEELPLGAKHPTSSPVGMASVCLVLIFL